jgi:hypothetical protein
MKIKLIASLVIAGGLSLATAGTASAMPLAHSGHPKPKPKPKHSVSVQVTGDQLAGALLAGSAWGSGYTLSNQSSTGGKLHSAQATQTYACGDLDSYEPYFGETAEAFALVNAPSSLSLSSNSEILEASEDVSQFASAGSAWSYLMQAQNTYRTCKATTVTINSGGVSGTVTLGVPSVSWTKDGADSGVVVAQTVTVADSSGDSVSLYMSTSVINAGPDVYSVMEMNTASAGVPDSMVNTLIDRVQALSKTK